MYWGADYGETERARMGLSGEPKYLKSLEPFDEDRNRAQGGLCWDQDDTSVRFAALVAGKGAIVLRAEFDEEGKAVYKGMSLLTTLQIETGEL